MKTDLTSLIQIKYPIVQAGMVWCSPWQLAAAVSNIGGLGTIGAGSMYPNILKEHLEKIRSATNNPYAVNIPLLYPQVEELIDLVIQHKVPVVITSAGNPKTYTAKLKDAGCKVFHVVSSAKFALKAEAAGVDAVIAEGFEAGGHNGREETTTLCLIPIVKKAVSIPVIAAGGIGGGRAMAAMMALGADGVQIGSLFVASKESSAHQNFKNEVINTNEGGTALTLKEVTPVRLIKNSFYHKVIEAYQQNASVDELKQILGKGRAKKGMFEGELSEGELEIGQVSAQINKILPAQEIFKNILTEFELALNELNSLSN